MLRRLLLLSLVVISLPAAAADRPAAAATEPLVLLEGPILTGRVLDAASGKPLAGAQVSPANDPGRTVTTDEAGRFQLVAPASRRLALGVRAAGFLPRRVTLGPAQLKTGRVPTVALEPAARLHGRVVDGTGRGLPEAVVVAVPAADLTYRQFAPTDPVAGRAASGADGSFTLDPLRPGAAFEVRASRPGFFPAAATAAAPPAGAPGRALSLALLPVRPLRGRVEDADRRPLAGVEIELRLARRAGLSVPEVEPGAPADAGTRPRSDDAGRFVVPEPPAAEVDLLARKPGFAPVRRHGLRLPPGSGPVDVGTLVLRPGAELGGRIVDQRERPVAKARVFVVATLPPAGSAEERLRDAEPAATAAPDGRFVVRDQPRGVPLQLAVLAEGYLPALVRDVRPPTARPLLIRLAPAFALTGRVVAEDRQPVGGASVALASRPTVPGDPQRRPAGPPIVRLTTTRADGRFAVGALPPGDAELDVAAPGFVAVEDLAVSVPPSDPRQELTVVLARGSVLQGRITTTLKEPIAGVRVAVAGTTAFSDGEGLYLIEAVPAGGHDVQVSHPHYGRTFRRKTIEPGLNLLDVELEAGTVVSGRVLDESGGPVPGALLKLTSRDATGGSYSARSAEDGGFRLTPVARGRYSLRAEAAGFAPAELESEIQVERRPVGGIEIVLHHGAALAGRVLGLSADELTGVSVAARDAIGRSFPARLDADGRYRIDGLSAGDWQVRAALWAGQREVTARVVIAPADREVVRDLEFQRRLVLSGQVLYDEEPLPETQVAVRAERYAGERSVLTDYDGRFRLEDLEPDRYWLGLRNGTKLLVHNDTVELTEDRELLIRLQAATVSGRVVAADSGKPIADALLLLRHPAGAEGPEFLVTGGTGEDGSFELFHVPAAKYQLTARAEGFAQAVQELQVAGGSDVSGLELRLAPTQGLALNVRLASGLPPAQVHLLVQGLDGQTVIAETVHPQPSGDLRLTTLPAGTWKLFVSGSGGGTVVNAITAPGEPVAVVLPAAGRLTVRVPALAGGDSRESAHPSPDALARLTIRDANQQPFWYLGLGGRIEQQWTLVGGVGSVAAVPAGHWTLLVEAPDGRSWSTTVSSSGAADQLVNLE